MPTPRSNSAALGLAPLILRVVLGVTFLWAGLGKWMGTISVKGQDAAVLANLGIIEALKPPIPTPSAAPAKPLPSSRAPEHTQGFPLILAQITLGQTTPKPPATTPTPVTAGPPLAVAADFPDPIACRALWLVALRVHQASHPGVDPQTAKPRMSLWPAAIGDGLWPKCMAVAVFIAEFAGGIGLLLGLFTRLSAFAIACTMLGAIWLDQIGPGLQSGQTMLGFLPARAAWDEDAWRPLLWQFALLGSALALMLLGSGALAFDRAIAGFRAAGGGGGSSNTKPASAGGPRAKG